MNEVNKVGKLELETIEQGLWNSHLDASNYRGDAYQQHLLEQYKMCLELADRISQRRGIANTFFLTFNTAIVGALSAFFEKIPESAALAFYVSALGCCIAWALLLRSYRTLNTAKFKVIGLIEKRLPASPLWSAEWKALGEGRDYRKHLPLTPIETFVPIGFFVVYCYLTYITFADSAAGGGA